MRFLSQGRDGAACSFDHYARLFPRRNLAMGLAAANCRVGGSRPGGVGSRVAAIGCPSLVDG